jgi:hypothetical protein
MKTFILSVCLSILLAGPVVAQNQRSVHVNFADTLNTVLSMGFQYLYPAFTRGTVYFTTGQATTSYLNYNILMNEIHFMDLATIRNIQFKDESEYLTYAQSLVLTDVRYVLIGSDHFFNTPRGIMYLVANYDPKLLRKDFIKLKSQSNIGAYGMQTQVSSIEARTNLPSSPDLGSEGVKPKIVTEYTRKTDFFLFRDGKVYSANRKGFERMFRNKRNEIRQYVKDNRVDFNNEDDLVKLLEFCTR